MAYSKSDSMVRKKVQSVSPESIQLIDIDPPGYRELSEPMNHFEPDVPSEQHVDECLQMLDRFSSPPEQKSLKDILNEAPLDRTAQAQTERILRDFNEGILKENSCFVKSRIRGEQISPGTFMLGTRNNRAELHGPSDRPVARRWLLLPGQFTKIIDLKVSQAAQIYGADGRFVLNVPSGQYGLAMSGNKPVIYGEGCHVIHDPNFKRDTPFKMEPQSSAHIEYQTLHILRVPVGKYARITIGSEFYILKGRKDPYVFDNPFFKLIPRSNSDLFIDQFEPYISNGTKHIVRVPAGKIAKAWIGSKAMLLEAREAPYVFDNPLFRLESTNNQPFLSATERLIEHGNIKRVIPQTGEVAIAYNNGQLQILKPNEKNEPYIVESATYKVGGFLSVGIETMVFPSEATKKQRQLDNSKASADEVSYECFTTRDSLKIGVKLLVAFRIKDAEKALKALINKEGILKHIENITTVDMGKAIQKCSSQEFLNFYQTKPVKPNVDLLTNGEEPKPLMHYQDDVKADLQKDLEEYGIELVRLNVETPKILDETIASKMSQVAIQSAESNADESTMDQKYRVSQRKAQQEAETKRIEQEQVNNATKSTADADLAAAKQRAATQICKAEADKKEAEYKADAAKVAILRKAEADAEATVLLGEAKKKAMDLEGEALNNSPALLQLKQTEMIANALAQSHISLTSSDFANLICQRNAPFGFFANNTSPVLNSGAIEHQHTGNKL